MTKSGNSILATGRILQIDKHIPFSISDQLPEYDDALLHAYGVWVRPEREGNRGR